MNVLKYRRAIDGILLVSIFLFLLGSSIKKNRDCLIGSIWSDVEGYYSYLPAAFIQGDFHHIRHESMDFRKNDKGEIVIKYTYGLTFFYLPFFLAAHLYAHIFHYEANGFSVPYDYAMIICTAFWAAIGLYLLKRLLLKYFSWRTTWVTIICIMLGTNFYHYATNYIGMPHIFCFAIIAGILLATDAYYEAPGKSKAVLLAVLFGWLVVIRPTNCAFLIVILLYRVVTMDDLKQRLRFLKGRVSDIIMVVPFFILPMIPQLFYWKEMYGKWVTYSYSGETFIYWKHPKILAVLFDTQNGLLLYSPILLFIFPGLVLGRKDKRTSFLAVSVVFVVITYIFASWWAWWFGGAFGHRCYIDYFPAFAFPMAIAMEKIFEGHRLYLKIPVTMVILLMLYYSVEMSLLFYPTHGFWDGPDWRWNWHAWANLLRQIHLLK